MAIEPSIMVSTRFKSDRVVDFEQWVRDIVEASASIEDVMPALRWFRQSLSSVMSLQEDAPDGHDATTGCMPRPHGRA